MSSVTSHQACIEIHPPALYKAEHSSGKYSRFTQEITGERPYCGEEGFKIQNQNNYTSFIDVCIVDPSADKTFFLKHSLLNRSLLNHSLLNQNLSLPNQFLKFFVTVLASDIRMY